MHVHPGAMSWAPQAHKRSFRQHRLEIVSLEVQVQVQVQAAVDVVSLLPEPSRALLRASDLQK